MKINLLRYLSSFIFPHKVEERKSAVSGRVEVIFANGKYMLDSAHVNYSFGGLHTVLRKAFSHFKIRDRDIKTALILGFGSGSAASILQDEYGKNSKITGVEKDPEVIALAKKYFSIDRYADLELHCEDAGTFVQNCQQQFDLILMDVFVDRDVPGQFSEDGFITALGRLLSGKGILFYNLVVHNEKVRDKGARLYTLMNERIGPTEWLRLYAQRTENWVFVTDLALPKHSAEAGKTKKP